MSSPLPPNPSPRPAVTQETNQTSLDRALGERLVSALSQRNWEEFASCFLSEARFRALVPSGPLERRGSEAITKTVSGWFGDADRLELLGGSSEMVADRLHIQYRFRATYESRPPDLVEQQAFCIVEHGRIAGINLVCSGFRPEAPVETHGEVHSFDAGELGCGSGLPAEFRVRLSAIPIGATLEVVTGDPSAKEDLPSLARMLGQELVSIGTAADGRSIITVRRNR